MSLSLIPEQVPTDFVPMARGSSSGSEKRATEFYPWVPEDGETIGVLSSKVFPGRRTQKTTKI
jgi:hypothetical protein